VCRFKNEIIFCVMVLVVIGCTVAVNYGLAKIDNVIVTPVGGTTIENAVSVKPGTEIVVSPKIGKGIYKWDERIFKSPIRLFKSFKVEAPKTEGLHCLTIKSGVFGKEYRFYYYVQSVVKR